MVENCPQETARSVASLSESVLESIGFKCINDKTHSKDDSCAVINVKTGKLDCRKCLIRNHKSQEILRIGYLTDKLPLEIRDTLENLELAEESIQLNIESCKENPFFKIMQGLSGEYSNKAQIEDFAKVQELTKSLKTLSEEIDSAKSEPETLFTYNCKVQEIKEEVNAINQKYQSAETSDQEQEAIKKVLELSESERRGDVLSFLQEIEGKSQTETILAPLVMKSFEMIEILKN